MPENAAELYKSSMGFRDILREKTKTKASNKKRLIKYIQNPFKMSPLKNISACYTDTDHEFSRCETVQSVSYFTGWLHQSMGTPESCSEADQLSALGTHENHIYKPNLLEQETSRRCPFSVRSPVCMLAQCSEEPWDCI